MSLSRTRHGVSGTIETDMSASAGLAKAVLTSNENGSPMVAFNGAISLSTKIPPEISTVIMIAATSLNLSTAVIVTF